MKLTYEGLCEKQAWDEAGIALPDGKVLRAFVTHLISKASDPDGVRLCLIEHTPAYKEKYL